ncbi:YraN family protein [Cardinium endosymbiont of Culicoides punctatus]|uniref:YraN family protein n=1 Tax=Cardinium endosymbiont of Culicoides punctatus TaxID=2304601 RepID=UPI0010E789D2|nr:YraN family protein [Cardinium endosymbiont of Culicoides punctatus]TDG94924.1 hypothetical protein CCPUN_07100 [Cardinium endosymbiont of Culicoides punctatus]
MEQGFLNLVLIYKFYTGNRFLYAMSNKSSSWIFGQYAEEIAANYLEKKGFEILVQNFRYKRFEIDLIARHKNITVFVEVKARKNNLFGNPEDFVNKKKIRRLRIAAEYYLYTHDCSQLIRFDIISILKNKENEFEIIHLEDGFY